MARKGPERECYSLLLRGDVRLCWGLWFWWFLDQLTDTLWNVIFLLKEHIDRNFEIYSVEFNWGMIKAPPLKSLGLHIWVFHDKSKRGAFNMFKNYVQKSSKRIKKVKNADIICLTNYHVFFTCKIKRSLVNLVMYFDQLLLVPCKAHVVYSDQLLGAALCIHFISNHDSMLIAKNGFSPFCFGADLITLKWFNTLFYI